MINKITNNLEAFNYNVIIANIYEIYNFINKIIDKEINGKILKQSYKKILILISPVVPHYSTECLSDLKILENVEWPKTDKSLLVEEDFKERGPRKYLNLGHTFGHAFEKMYPISHGEAVYWGMQLLFHVFKREDLIKECDDIMRELNLSFGNPPWGPSLSDPSSFINDLMDLVKRDKKVISEKEIELVFINEKRIPYLLVCEFGALKSKLDIFLKENDVGIRA